MKANRSSQTREENLLAGRPDAGDFLVVGLGASAGGVQALTEFFENLPANTGMAYVVILHLSPDYDSQLREILQRVSPLTVVKVTKKTAVKKDHIYVVPPNQHLEMVDTSIVVSDNVQEEDRRAPVDIFFRTLATALGPRAICVVLSGTGANGSMGLKHVKECGGAAFVQNPKEAEFNEMPRNAIATGLVDEILPVAEIPAKIISYKASLNSVHIPVDAEKRPEEQQQALREIFSQLRLRTGHDFSNYKRPTLLRRIERRINIRNLPDLPSYAAYIEHHPDETTALLKDLLISVTNFFRDSKAFEVMEKDILPRLIKSKTSEEQLRIWVAGCATGEEAYSLAMLCADKTLGSIDAPKIQIFATDIDEAAIAHSREGFYTINDAADIPPERLRRFFNKEGEGYRIRREIREMVLFATHNFIKDPPFSHLDIVSCRNVLIYLNYTAQERVMETFHFALNPGGYLFLGSSESATGSGDLYTIFSREHHIFQSRQLKVHSYPVPESVPSIQTKPPDSAEREHRTSERITVSDLHRRLLEQYAPPSLVVNEEYDIVHLSERAGKYLQIAGGEPSQNLLKLIRPELRLELRSALYQATQRQSAVEAKGLKVTVGEHTETVSIHVRPVFREGDIAKGFSLVLFERTSDTNTGNDIVLTANEPVARQLEEELMRVKAQLRTSIEQHEFHAEELKASNEELQAMNEELRSAAEELETSKEELQSINEELRTVNQELKVKIEETTFANNNLQNLINSVDIGTIFLDRSFRVVLFTPAIRALFNLIPADFGRPLSDITHRLTYMNIMADAELVLDKLQSVEREIHTTSGQLFMMRVLPYRTEEDRINGVVITFFDITEHKRTEESLRESEGRHAFLLKLSDAIRPLNSESEIQNAASRVLGEHLGAERIYYSNIEGNSRQMALHIGYVRNGHYGMGRNTTEVEVPSMLKTGRALVVNDIKKPPSALPEQVRAVYATLNAGSFVVSPQLKDNKLVWVLTIISAVEREWTVEEAALIREVAERTWEAIERVRAADALRQSEERFRAIISQATAGICRATLEGEIVFVNRKFSEMLFYNEQEMTGSRLWDYMHPADQEANIQLHQKAMENGVPFDMECRLVRRDYGIVWVSISMAFIRDRSDVASSTVAVILDITERKTIEHQKEDFIGIASHELKTPVTSIKAYAQMLQEIFEEAGDEKSAGMMQKLDAQVDRLMELLNALLDTTRIGEDRLRLKREPFDMNQLIREQVEDLQGISKKHRIITRLGELQPITADREHIGQVLTNLVANALKYSPDGGDVIVSTTEADGNVKITVQDFGIGIPDNVKHRVFDRFFRVSNPKVKAFPGMGLGLYITAGIVHYHHGSISVESKEGEGTTFSVTIPYDGITAENGQENEN
jgi:two-component system CheB/CheR fusion protein